MDVAAIEVILTLTCVWWSSILAGVILIVSQYSGLLKHPKRRGLPSIHTRIRCSSWCSAGSTHADRVLYIDVHLHFRLRRSVAVGGGSVGTCHKECTATNCACLRQKACEGVISVIPI